ncbi:phage shock protein C (PspC) family protein [Dokdonia sp. Hel_I_63]|uniref:PspC domain-containing protein n=1 Tax=Dokdonia sp. Hel_I_63 TaxID=1249996 RepID=UPI00119C68D6|nr:PspC domain-containing protein [Dokdonia sp. Hel_I_63]TVZ22339.1 phage shock protein C (PspC) family protein [Dokdonia sp. Hel_I_63]
MNKTVNINLAGVFFHVDEDAYGKLQRYLAAIKRSFEGVQGEDEIIADIEARISELFSERIKDERQVISTKELDEVIAIMGQPEDYMVDDDIFEDTASSQKSSSRSSSKTQQAKRISDRRFFRDTDNAYIGGVSSGMAHYMGLDPLWVRVGWVLLIALTWFTLGGTALIYLALWVFVPEAQSTADKLAMRGKAVNIDNITEKVKEGFENVADTVKNVDYDKYGNKVKTGAQGVFGTLGKIIMFFFKIIAKIVGVLLIITGATVVISLLITLLTGGVVDIFTPNLADMPWISNDTGLPIWLMLLLVLFAVGIPFFFLFYLGLKILSSNVKSMPLSAKLSLLGLWLIASITIGVFSVKQAIQYSNLESSKVTTTETLAITKNDTLRIKMRGSERFDIPFGRSSQYVQLINSNTEDVAVYRNVRLIVRSTRDSLAYVQTVKRTKGSSYDVAKEQAEAMMLNYDLSDNELAIDGFFTGERDAQYRHVRPSVEFIVYLPEGATLIADENTYSYHRNDRQYRDILDNGDEEKFLTVGNGKLICSTCPEDRDNDDDNSWQQSDDNDAWEERSYREGEDTPAWETNNQAPNSPTPPPTPQIDRNSIN